MNEWVKQEVDRIRETGKRVSDDRSWQQFRANSITAKWQDIWKPIREAVRQDAKDFSDQFAGERQKQLEFNEVPSRGLIVRKPFFPAVTVEARIDEQRQVIDYRFTRTQSHQHAPTPEDGIFDIDIENGGFFCVKRNNIPMTASEISAFLLRPIFDSFH